MLHHYIRGLIPGAIVAAVAFYAVPAWAGHMFLEHRGELAAGYTFYRGAFDLGDIDRDGFEEMVIGDDSGGYHVYRFTHSGFVPMWISDPIVANGYIVAVEIILDKVPGVRPQILILDSKGTLHKIAYSGYLFEETETFQNYRMPNETGRIVVTDIGGGERNVLIAISDENSATFHAESDTSSDDYNRWAGMTLYQLTAGGLTPLTQDEVATLNEGEVYFVKDLSAVDIERLISLGVDAGRLFPGSNYSSGRATIADLDRDALLELLVAVSDPDRPIDRLEIYSSEGGSFNVKLTLELPLINEMVIGDIDGDHFPEIVGLTFDGDVLVYQYDPLTVKLPDGTEIDWEIPHLTFNGEIWMSLGGFESLGCTAVEEPDKLTVSYEGNSVTLDRTGHVIRCGSQIIHSDLPAQAYESSPFLPFFKSLNCLGFTYTYSGTRNLVQVTPPAE